MTPGFCRVGSVWTAALLVSHCGDWLLQGTMGHWIHLQALLHLFLRCCYLSTFLEMCLLMSVYTREKPRQSESSEAHSCFCVCSGPVQSVRELRIGLTISLFPRKHVCWWRNVLRTLCLSALDHVTPDHVSISVQRNGSFMSSLCKGLVFTVENKGKLNRSSH